MSFWARALRNEALHEIQQQESETLRELLRELVGKAQEEGAISTDHEIEEVIELLGGVIDGVSLHALLYPDRLPAEKQAKVMEFALSLLK